MEFEGGRYEREDFSENCRPGDLRVGAVATTKRTRSPHRATFASVAKQAAKVGIEVARYEVDPDSGKITVVPGKPDGSVNPHIRINSNEWDEVLQ